jgi:hypothetical protein
MPELPLLQALETFFDTRLLGPDRIALLASHLDDADQAAPDERARRLAASERQIADLTQRQERLLHQAESAETADPFTAGLRRRYNDLDIERRTLEAQHADLLADPPQAASAANVQELLAHLPTAAIDVAALPQQILRTLCEAFRIRISYDHESRRVHYTAEIEAGELPRLNDLINRRAQICGVPPAVCPRQCLVS